MTDFMYLFLVCISSTTFLFAVFGIIRSELERSKMNKEIERLTKKAFGE